MTPHPKKVKPKFKTVRAWAIMTRFGFLRFGGNFENLQHDCYVVSPHKYPLKNWLDKEKSKFKRDLIEVEIRIPTKRGER